MGNGNKTGCYGRSRSATRASGRSSRIPRVAGRPEKLGFGSGQKPKLGRIGFAKDEKACLPEPSYQLAVVIGNKFL